MSTSSKSISSIQMGKRFSLRQAMKSSQKYPLSEIVHVDEFTVEGKEEESCNSSRINKKHNIKQKFSHNGANFKELHIVIMQLKSWLRAIPTHVSKWHIQAYFDEFCFRINRSQFKQSIFHKTTERMVASKPVYHSQIKQILSV